MTVPENKRVSTRATGIVGIAILCSRVLGLIREVVFAALFGAILLGERMSLQGVAGCALIFFAMIAVELIPALRKRAGVRTQ